MTSDLWFSLLAVLGLIAMSGFFSGSETALTAVSRARMLQRSKQGEARAGIVSRLTETRERLIGALLLGNNLVNILASALATSVFLQLFGEAGVFVATAVMTAVILVFAEVLPKTWAIASTDRFALFVAPVVRVLVFVFAPITAAVQVLVRSLLKLFGVTLEADQDILSAHEEIRGQVDLLHQEGSVRKTDRDRVGGILDLHDLEVSDVMIHRTNVEAINIDDGAKAIVQQVLSSAYTRLPLWEREPENIIGILHAKDLLRVIHGNEDDIDDLDIRSIAMEPWFVPETTGVQHQLNAFLRRKAHFALVIDEYGEFQGILTLEDILEEIVGEISDEYDTRTEGVRQGPNGSIYVEGSVPIRDLNRAMDWELPDEHATTVAGLVIHEARLIPETKQAFTFHGYRFEVLRKSRNRITQLRISPATS